MSRVFKQSCAIESARLVLLALGDHASDDGYCWPSVAKLTKYAALADERSTRRILRRLEDSGELYTLPNAGGRSKTNEYLVCVGLTADEIASALVRRCNMAIGVAVSVAQGIIATQNAALSAKINPDPRAQTLTVGPGFVNGETRTLDAQTRTLDAETLTAGSPDPSIDPSTDPSVGRREGESASPPAPPAPPEPIAEVVLEQETAAPEPAVAAAPSPSPAPTVAEALDGAPLAAAPDPTTARSLTQLPAIVAYREVFLATPSKALMAQIARRGIDDLSLWERAITEWCLAGYNPCNIGGMFDWYDHPERIPENRNANRPTAVAASAPGRRAEPNRRPAWADYQPGEFNAALAAELNGDAPYD